MAATASRLTSVDVFRGATMAAMVIVNTPGDWGAVYWPLLHAEWHGWTPTDLIFPFFVFALGVSITLSRRRAAAASVILRRAAVIDGLGLLLALYPRFDFATVRLVGVLARLSFCYLAAAGLVSVVAGLLWSVVFPINKSLWTSSYVLFTSGLAAIALALLHRVVDLSMKPAQWTRPFVVMGTNALALFVFSGWMVKTLIAIRVAAPDGGQITLYRWIHETVFVPLAPPKLASVLFALAALAVLYGLLEVMYRRRWFLRA